MKKMLNLQGSFLKLMFSSALATIIMIVIFLCKWLTNVEKVIFYYGIISTIVVRSAFGKTTLQRMIARVLALYGTTFFIGGIGNFIYYQLNQNQYLKTLLMKGIVKKANVEVLFILIGSVLLALPVLQKVSGYIKQEYMTKCKVTLYYRGKSITGMALIDTGNQLKDWVTNDPVSIVEKNFINGLFEENTKQQIEMYQKMQVSKKVIEESWETDLKIKYIPYHSLGNEKGILIGMYLEEMSFNLKNKEKKMEHPLIGIYEGKLSANQDYQIILHRELLE